MSQPYVLVAEDNEDVIAIIKAALKKSGYRVEHVKSGLAALESIRREKPDYLILDIMMPEIDGVSLCRILRGDDEYNDVAILFLSALNKTQDVVQGLDAGGDDYLTKPFEIEILKARLRALGRRDKRPATEEAAPVDSNGAVIQVGSLTLDSDSHKVATPQRAARLTATEHRLLRFMMEHPDQVLSAGTLLEEVWSYPPNTGDADLVRAHMRKLRAKIENDPNEPAYLHTIHGVGYMIADESSGTKARS